MAMNLGEIGVEMTKDAAVVMMTVIGIATTIATTRRIVIVTNETGITIIVTAMKKIMTTEGKGVKMMTDETMIEGIDTRGTGIAMTMMIDAAVDTMTKGGVVMMMDATRTIDAVVMKEEDITAKTGVVTKTGVATKGIISTIDTEKHHNKKMYQ